MLREREYGSVTVGPTGWPGSTRVNSWFRSSVSGVGLLATLQWAGGGPSAAGGEPCPMPPRSASPFSTPALSVPPPCQPQGLGTRFPSPASGFPNDAQDSLVCPQTSPDPGCTAPAQPHTGLWSQGQVVSYSGSVTSLEGTGAGSDLSLLVPSRRRAR